MWFVKMQLSIRKVVIFSLWASLIVWMFVAIQKKQQERTYFATSSNTNAFYWPVITVCPMSGTADHKTFDNVMSEIKASKDIFK